jgi:Na+-transporting methylmalonyl-CoA/oxaloacetate decarboxylase gamma subunit
METYAPILLLILGVAVVFSFVATVLWIGARKKER